MLVPNDNYCKFEDWIMPVLNQMLKEQKELGTNWTPSKVSMGVGAGCMYTGSPLFVKGTEIVEHACP